MDTTDRITNLGATATEHDTETYSDTAASGDQTTYAARQREPEIESRDCDPSETQGDVAS